MGPFVRPAAIQRADRTLARSVFLLLVAIYTATFTGLPEHDGEVEFQTVSSLVRNQDLALGGTDEADYIVERGFAVREGAGEKQGRYYSWFGIGQAIVGVPFYVAGRGLSKLLPRFEERHAETTLLVDERGRSYRRSEYFAHLVVGWRNSLLTAMTASLIFLAARYLGAHRIAGWVAAVGYGLCTYAWPQARSTLNDVQATFFLFLAFYLLLKLRERFDHYGRARVVDLFLFGAALGMSFLTRLTTALALPVLFLGALLVLTRGRRHLRRPGSLSASLALILVPSLGCLGFFFWVNEARFGDPLEPGYGLSPNYFSYPALIGLASLFIAPGKGLLVMAPPVLLAPFGFLRAWRRGERLWPWTMLAMLVGIPFLYAFSQGWHGAWTYGPRYLLPLVPYLWVGVALGLEPVTKTRRGGIFAGALFLLGFLTALPGVLVDQMTYHDLAIRAAPQKWPVSRQEDWNLKDEVRFVMIHWSGSFAEPWAHWRILRHRLAHRRSYPAEPPPYVVGPLAPTERSPTGTGTPNGWPLRNPPRVGLGARYPITTYLARLLPTVIARLPSLLFYVPAVTRTVPRAERFPVDEIFFVGDRGAIYPFYQRYDLKGDRFVRAYWDYGRYWGFGHLAWVDFHRRLGGPVWPVLLACLVAGFAGIVLAARGSDPTLR